MAFPRERQETIPTPNPGWSINGTNGYLWVKGTPSGYTWLPVKKMWDLKERFRADGHYPWHPMSIVRINQVRDPPPQYVIPPPVWYPWMPPTVYTYGGDFFPVTWSPDGFYNGSLHTTGGLIPNDEADVFVRRHLDNIFQQMPMTCSIVNFIAELKDGIRGLLPRIRSLWTALPSMHLWWNFGALPFVRDLKELCGIFDTVANRLKYLKDRNHQWTNVRTICRYTSPLAGQVPAMPPNWNPEWNTESMNGAPTGILWDELKVKMQTAVYYDLDFSGFDPFLMSMVSALGFDNPVGILWEALPYSFVVDWFEDIGDYIEQNVDTHQPFEGTISTNGSYTTITRRTMYETYLPTHPGGGLEPWCHTLVRQCHRRAGLPSSTPELSGLTQAQQLLSASLLAQGIGSLKYRR